MILGIVEIGLYGVRGKLSRTICPTLCRGIQVVRRKSAKLLYRGSIPLPDSKMFAK